MPKFKFDSHQSLIICRAKIVSRKRQLFLKLALDTGATKTIIPPEAALRIGINPAKSHKTIEITTGSGTALCPIVTIPSFACFGITIKNLEVVCHTLPPESPVEGLLGLNFFKNIKLTLDFHNHTLEVI